MAGQLGHQPLLRRSSTPPAASRSHPVHPKAASTPWDYSGQGVACPGWAAHRGPSDGQVVHARHPVERNRQARSALTEILVR